MRKLALVVLLSVAAAAAQDFTAAVRVMRPSVVSVFTDKLKRVAPTESTAAHVVPTEGVGSGAVIDTLGHILTCDHVVAGYTDLSVKFDDGTVYETPDVVVTGRDPVTDIAVIQVKANRRFVPAKVGDSDGLEVGQPVLALGSPFGLEGSASAGIVSALSRWGMVKSSGPDFQAFVQTDATINPGNSGGPLVDMQGRIVGVNSFIRTQNNSNTGIGFAVPSNLALDVAGQIIRYGRVIRGYLGTTTQAVTPEIQQAMGLASREGALVSQVTAGGPGAAAGLEPGDVVVGLGGVPIADVRQFQNDVAAVKPGSTVELAVLRGGQRRTLSARLGEWPGPVDRPRAVPVLKNWLGIAVADIPAADRQKYNLAAGVVVTQVEQGSPAADAGIKATDIIVALAGQELRSVADFESARQHASGNGKPVLAWVLRGRSAFFAAIPQ